MKLCMTAMMVLIVCSVVGATNDDEEDAVTVLGLGAMGTAVVQCLAQKNYTIHAWNRGHEKLQAVSDIAITHETPFAAVQATNLTLILIDDWEGVVDLVENMLLDETIRANKTFVVFSTYTPTDIQKLQRRVKYNLVGGAIVAVPPTICSDKAHILMSTTAPIPALESVGHVTAFPGDDVGLAALANMALNLVITFGVAGQELASLMIRQYDHADAAFEDSVAALSAQVAPAYLQMLLPTVSQQVATSKYEHSYVPSTVFRKVLKMHAAFLGHLGIADDTFLAAYLRSLDKIENPKFGPAAWVEYTIQQDDKEL